MSKKSYNDNFKKQIVSLFKKGKSVLEISKEYDIGRSTIYKWIYQSENGGSFKTVDNRAPKENELISLKKRNKELEYLKKAITIMAQEK